MEADKKSSLVTMDAEQRTETLPCKLTTEEVATYSDNLAHRLADLGKIEAEKATAMSGFKGRIEAAEEEIATLARKVREKKEDRTVNVDEISDYVAAEISHVRRDTGEILRTRIMTMAERQRPLDFPKKVN